MSMTALVSAFARAYHAGREGAKIFEDRYARRLLSDEEYGQIGAHMAAGVSFFDPAFQGDADTALRRVMDGYLSPTPLARAAFAAEELARSGTGCAHRRAALSGRAGGQSGRSDESGVRQGRAGAHGAVLRPAFGIIPDAGGHTVAVLRALQLPRGSPYVCPSGRGLLRTGAGIKNLPATPGDFSTDSYALPAQPSTSMSL